MELYGNLKSLQNLFNVIEVHNYIILYIICTYVASSTSFLLSFHQQQFLDDFYSPLELVCSYNESWIDTLKSDVVCSHCQQKKI